MLLLAAVEAQRALWDYLGHYDWPNQCAADKKLFACFLITVCIISFAVYMQSSELHDCVRLQSVKNFCKPRVSKLYQEFG